MEAGDIEIAQPVGALDGQVPPQALIVEKRENQEAEDRRPWRALCFSRSEGFAVKGARRQPVTPCLCFSRYAPSA